MRAMTAAATPASEGRGADHGRPAIGARSARRNDTPIRWRFLGYKSIMNRSTDRFEAAALTACSFDRVAFAAGEENPNRRGRCPAICMP